MDKQRKLKITKKLENYSGSIYLTKSQICKALGYSRQSVSHLLYGLPKFNTKYLSDDIAERIMEVEKWNC